MLHSNEANGPAIIQSLSKAIPGIIAVNPEGGKESRANAVAPFFAAGNVYHPDATSASWISDHESELLRFPFGSYDDSVDCCTQALTYLHAKKSGYQAALRKLAGGEFSLV